MREKNEIFFLRNSNKKRNRKKQGTHLCFLCIFNFSNNYFSLSKVLMICSFHNIWTSSPFRTWIYENVTDISPGNAGMTAILFHSCCQNAGSIILSSWATKKNLHVQWIKEKWPLIFIFVISTEDYKINAKLQGEPGLLMVQITPPESEFLEIHTHVEVVKAAESKISRLSKPLGNHKTELHLPKKPTHQKCTLLKSALFKADLLHCPNKNQKIWFQLLIPAPPKSASS